MKHIEKNIEKNSFFDEERNDEEFARKLSSLGDIFVNDAFSCSHRKHASVDKITKFLPSYCGIQMNAEVNALKKVTTDIKKPIACIVGGSKISTKIGILTNLVKRMQSIVIVGAMANNFLKFKGISVGASLVEKGSGNTVKNINTLDIKQISKYYK